MKSTVTHFFAAMALLFMLGVVEAHGDVKIGTFKYKDVQWLFMQLGSSDACSVRPSSIKEEMEVPSSVTLKGGGTLKVSAIADRAFREQNGLKKITIPSSVRTIGKEAFYYCEGLAEVLFSEGLDSIGELAFSSCKALQELIFPSSLRTIGKEAFSTCTKIQTLVLREGVEYIGEAAFANCEVLRAVEIPRTVAQLPNKMCDGCKCLERIVLHEGLELIGEKDQEDGVFGSCTALREVMIPSTVKGIAMLSFSDCKALERVYIPSAGSCELGEGIFYECNRELEVYVPESKVDAIKKLKVMEKVNVKGGYIVTFTAEGGAPETQVQLVAKGESARRPYAPERPGYRLKGWNKEGAAYDFTAAVEGDITLVGVWAAADKELSYDKNVLIVRLNGKEVESGAKLAEGDELEIAMHDAGKTFEVLSVNGTPVEGAKGKASYVYTVRAEDARVEIGFEDKEGTAVESLLLAGVRVVENPVGEMLVLEGVEAAVRVEVYSLMGQCVARQHLLGEERVEINSRGWAAGVYIVRVAARDGVKALRVVKR